VLLRAENIDWRQRVIALLSSSSGARDSASKV
jgi:hypothetical protein